MELNGILSLVGNTPLIQLKRLFDDIDFELYAKMEMSNPAGSIKDRPALTMILEAFKKGEIDGNTTIIESSSGNMGVALAQICTVLNLKFICVTDIRATQANRQIIHGYGGSVDLISEPDSESGFLGARLKRVEELLNTIPNSFNCNQYQNSNHPIAHHQTMHEIISGVDGDVDYLFCATSTCGSLKGCSDYISQHKLSTKVIAVDAQGSIIFGDTPKPRLIPGHGAAIVPPFYRNGMEDNHILVSDLDCVRGCRQLMRKEGIFAGGSSGAIISAIATVKDTIPSDAKCVAILYDRGGRYLDTIYSDDWVEENFGNIPNL